MADFRKWIPVLALLALMAVTASAQTTGPALTCTSNAGVPPIVRAEGLAELVGDVVLNCTGGDPNVTFTVNWQIFLNTNVTSRLLSTGTNATESLLMVDELTATAGIPCLSATQTGCSRVNTWRGTLQQANSIVWLGVPFTPPGSTGQRIIRITNVRANANQIGASSTLVPSQIVMYISASGTQSVPINNPQQTVAFIQPGLSFTVRNCANSGSPNNSFAQCASNNSSQFGDATVSGDTGASGRRPGSQLALKYVENFATAFKPILQVNSDQNAQASRPGIVYNAESGFVHAALGLETGYAWSGTRLIARFNNIPAGVNLQVATANISAASFRTAPFGSLTSANATTAAASFGDDVIASPTLQAVLVATDPNGNAGYLGTTFAAPISPSSSCNRCNSTSTATTPCIPASQIAVSATGTATAVWEVIAADPSVAEAALFPVVVSYSANTSANLPGLGTATVQGGFAPIMTGSAAGTAQQGPIPRFADVTISRTAFSISTCVTNLLFPYLVNAATFDTGVVIANTSKDPFGTAAQAGTCKLNFYGTTTGGGAAPAALTSQSIASGDSMIFSLSSGGTHGIGTQAAGFTGYMIAQCGFRFGHGFAFISDVGAQKLAMGYLALVMNDSYRDLANSENLNQ